MHSPRLRPLTTQTNPAHSGATLEGQPHLSLGGVARNLATALHYLGHKPHFLTALARDNLAKLALDQFEAAGFSSTSTSAGADCNQLRISWKENDDDGLEPASCFALVLMDSISGQCEYVIANLDAIKAISPQTIEQMQADGAIRGAPLLAMDANLRADTMETLVRVCCREQVPIFIEPTDVLALPRLVACIRKLQAEASDNEPLSICCMSPNLFELQRMRDLFKANSSSIDQADQRASCSLDEVEQLARDFMENCMPELECLLVTLDERGVLVALRSGHNENAHEDLGKIHPIMGSVNNRRSKNHNVIRTKHFEPLEKVEKPISASGAGDSFAAGFISGLLHNLNLAGCIEKGFRASRLALNARDTIPAELRSLCSTVEYPNDR